MTIASKKNNSLANAAFTVLVITVFAKIIGFVESTIVAAYFGTSAEIDMFYLACTISNRFVFTIFSWLAVVGLTMYNTYLKRDGEVGANKYVTSLICYIVPVAIGVTLLIYIFAPFIASVMASNYSDNEISILIKYLRELSLISVFYALTTIFTCVLNAHKKFVPGTLVGIIQNGTMILFVVSLSNRIGANSVVLGLVIAYILQTIFLYFCTNRVFKFTRCDLKSDIDIKRICLLVLPLILGEATAEINILTDQFLASIQGAGFVSGLAYSETLNDVVTALFIQTITTVLLAFFSKLAIEKEYKKMMDELIEIFKIITILLIPVSIITVTSAKEIVSVVFERGNFDENSVRITACALIGYGLGFIFKTLMVIAKRPFFAIENNRIPMKIGIYTVIINITLSILLSQIWGLFGITLATSVSYLLAVLFYMRELHKLFDYNFRFYWNGFTGKIIISSLIAISSVLIICNTHFYSNLVTLIVRTILCFSLFFISLLILKVNEVKMVLNKIKLNKQ